ncbi:MAG: PSD1 and planctomycete cytochrome C domain-containing protein [Planctomycetota bacterium]|nr:PSD1 and planctomycete cytochrome C domain-containing protein [Planctomycetota bacterium]
MRGLPLLLMIATATTGLRAEAAEPNDAARNLLSKHCFSCHGPDKQQGGLRLDQRRSLLAGGDSGEPAIRPGKPVASELIRRITSRDAEVMMPPKGPRLSSRAVGMISEWIRRGAVMPRDANTRTSHWSFQPLKPVRLPTLSRAAAARARSPIDRFIISQLAASQLQLSAPTDRRRLLRRASLVLTGLPPSPEQAQHFQADLEPGAWERAVDRLLANPRYGERWASHWLDLVRFAETTGYETNSRIGNAWYYRDYVIQAFNDDMPHDRFVFDQLAGDTTRHDAATGFLVAGPRDTVKSPDERLTRQQRQDELDEVISATGSVFLGLTIGCARCHSHKFDPIPQQDYYAVQAVFAGLRYGDRRIHGDQNDRWQARLPAVQNRLREIGTLREKLRKTFQLRKAIDFRQTTESFDAVTTVALRLAIHATNDGGSPKLDDLEAWTPAGDRGPSRNVALAKLGAVADSSSFAMANQSRLAENLIDGARKLNFFWQAGQPGPASVTITFANPQTIHRVILKPTGSSVPVDYDLQVPDGPDTWRTIAHSRDRTLHPDDRRAAKTIRIQGVAAADVLRLRDIAGRFASTRAEFNRLAAGPQGFLGNFQDPETTYRLKRGDPMQRLEQVAPDVPGLIGALDLDAGATETMRRIALARAIASPHNPLTPRVIVNRIWQHHFGTGLVDTPSDLGRNGARPTHPKLLDWLALDLVQHRWSLKHLHRRILLSATFRQSSRPRAEALASDGDTRLLWRFPPRRLEAEALRDSILAASGRLNNRMHGQGFDFYDVPKSNFGDYVPKEEFDRSGWRRMVYGTRIRLMRPGIFGAFDCPDAGQMAPKRSRSTTPVQSLGLFNSRFVNRQAEFLAQRARKTVGTDTGNQVQAMVKWTLGRRLEPEEQTVLVELARRFGPQQVGRVLLNSNEFVFLE